MNCKPGDLAVIVRAQKDQTWLGRFVTVLHRYPSSIDLAWVCNPIPEGFDGILDVSLRPIRDSDGEDETLTWAGKSQEVCARSTAKSPTPRWPAVTPE